MFMGLNYTTDPLINVSTSCDVDFSLEQKPENGISTIWQWIFISIKNVILKGHPILYPFKQKYTCDFNPRCLVSSGLMFDDIIMDMIRNK